MSASAGDSRGGRRQFHLLERIGEGAFGEVYLAEMDSGAGFRRRVAIKLLNDNVAGSKEAARRMRDEARILGRLSHRNIVSVLDLVRVDDRWAVIMDFVSGADLEQILHGLELTEAEFPVSAAFEVGSAVCRALDAAFHTDDGRGGQLQCIHRDIKPSNIRVTRDGEIKVLDFGVARVELDTREAKTRAEGWIGTERYMAPERILMEGDSLAGDVYATAASIIELLNSTPLGRTPVLPDRHDPFVEVALTKARERMKGPEAVVEDAIDSLRRALSADPAERPPARDLALRWGNIARRLEGETLAVFCERFVPRVGDLIGYHAVKVEGMLEETSSGAGGSTTRGSSTRDGTDDDKSATFALGTLIPDGDLTTSETPTTPGPPQRSPIGWIVLALALALFVGGTGAIIATVAVTRGINRAPVAEVPVAAPAPVPEPAPVPAPEPVPEPKKDTGTEVAPEPQAQPAPAPEPVAAAPRPAPRTTPKPAPAPAPAPEPAVVVIPADAPRIERALVVLKDASSVEVTCADRTASGTASADLRDFVPGACTVRANYLGSWLSTGVAIERRREVICSVSGGKLLCE